MNKQEIANALLNVQKLPEKNGTIAYLQRLVNKEKINWEEEAERAEKIRARQEERKHPKTKTERIMDFLCPPEEQEPVFTATQKRAQFPNKTIAEIMAVDPIQNYDTQRYMKKLYDKMKVPIIVDIIEDNNSRHALDRWKMYKNV